MIYITGDMHGDFRRLGSKKISAGEGDYLIICGDFGGVWDCSKREQYWLKWLSDKPFTTLFADGNHENYDLLNAYPVTIWNGGKVHKISERVIHLMRGQVFNIEGSTFFIMGGASSHDISAGILEADDPKLKEKCRMLDKKRALYRINHVSWWADELPSEAETEEGLSNLKKHNYKVDYIISHCAPSSVQDAFGRGLHKHDALTDYLETVKEKCDFKYWFFGHYHENEIIDERFIMLYEKIIESWNFVNSEKENLR